MIKKPRPDTDTVHPAGWSIGSNGLTSHGQATVLKRLGDQMKDDYAQVVNEPLPVDLDGLMKMLGKLNPKPKGQSR